VLAFFSALYIQVGKSPPPSPFGDMYRCTDSQRPTCRESDMACIHDADTQTVRQADRQADRQTGRQDRQETAKGSRGEHRSTGRKAFSYAYLTTRVNVIPFPRDLSPPRLRTTDGQGVSNCTGGDSATIFYAFAESGQKTRKVNLCDRSGTERACS
jgi:hypothetical protein